MVVPGKFEIVAGYESQDAHGYAEEWTLGSVGGIWFVHKHDIKVQLTYRQNSDMKGVKGDDEDEIFLQAQYLF
ncbi:MAG: hypothetical protein GWO16_04125 [Gammaproteobacteria bacterium]|nr:hypothetical protein [Gammaproteobacteria bacterium]NIR98036.1 hypothetical protein [Gammaproteobacteria bacterium]NIT63743.1 hypothetical protein [Gammaproteobacteria bacterium]NIV19918.1 hypothetical protein [Gammaproteobacteria bacterium]NIX11407.1 hypothetical protein [Gammaproteobacteria bacterium]